ncbi:MAG: endonuclease [Defluviitaleaceae bacterium]|nr:endonuclease [Defluviitaleaceae bacterium]
MAGKLWEIYETLLERYGQLGWWPADSPYEVIVGAVLTQNTNWGNVEKAIANFGGRLSPQFVLAADMAELTNIVRPAGFFNQKAAYLKGVTAWFGGYDFDAEKAAKLPIEILRTQLLDIKGIGPETADSILLYAFGLPTFVIDAYTMRLCQRYPIGAGKTYAAAKAHFEGNLPKSAEVYNNFHALIVINGKHHCKKRLNCAGCPLERSCAKLGL